jgi:hypothetical protein
MIDVGVVGFGEVGRGIAALYDYEVHAEDPAKDMEIPDDVKLSVLHVCTPYFDGFENMVIELFFRHCPDCTIVNSTVPVGTTERIGRNVKRIVHSPVRASHPNMEQGLRHYVKFIGADDNKTGLAAAYYFKEVGVPVRVVAGSRTTELAKLLDTTYYGTCIAFHKYAKGLCDREGLNFEDVMTEFNRTYNIGVLGLDKANFARPVLYPPEGPIGGHCVVPNIRLLEAQYGPILLFNGIE